MQVVNKDTYQNCIYRAIVVNADQDSDPEDTHKVQIYIPALQYEYNDIYQEYIDDDNKDSSAHKDKFPWVFTTIKNIRNGCTVFVGNVGNKNDNYIILGLDGTDPDNDDLFDTDKDNENNEEDYDNSDYDINNIIGGSLVELALPIIVSNEVDITPTDWPNNIDDSKYEYVVPYDGAAEN